MNESEFLRRLMSEIKRADQHAPYNSAHEAYGVLAEEVDEFWDEVKKKRRDRNPEAMRDELVQIAAVAWRAAKCLELVEG
jgi:NTP pyrophosphatase (non-canonical NTP hydrolase)